MVRRDHRREGSVAANGAQRAFGRAASPAGGTGGKNRTSDLRRWPPQPLHRLERCAASVRQGHRLHLHPHPRAGLQGQAGDRSARQPRHRQRTTRAHNPRPQPTPTRASACAGCLAPSIDGLSMQQCVGVDALRESEQVGLLVEAALHLARTEGRAVDRPRGLYPQRRTASTLASPASVISSEPNRCAPIAAAAHVQRPC